MADYSPTWDEIAGAWQDALGQIAGVGRVFYPYPENAIDITELPAIVINEPQDSTPTGFTLGAFSMEYTGNISLLVKAVDTGQARLTKQDIAEVEAAFLGFAVAVYRVRLLANYACNIRLGSAKTARFSPYDDDNRGHYAGKDIPYTLTMQYRSRL